MFGDLKNSINEKKNIDLKSSYLLNLINFITKEPFITFLIIFVMMFCQ